MPAVAAAAAPATELIPGLPEDVSEQCLLRLPPPYYPPARRVSLAWKHALSSPEFLRRRRALLGGESRPFLFVLAYCGLGPRLQWNCLDTVAQVWSPLPTMPVPERCAGVAVVGDDDRKSIHVLGGVTASGSVPLATHIIYDAANSSWTAGAPLPTARSHFSAGVVAGGLIAVAGGDAAGLASADVYNPITGEWSPASPMRRSFVRYDSVVVGGRLHITEGWSWPFDFRPRGALYDAAGDAWMEVPPGLLDGWTGNAVVAGGKLYNVADYGDGKVKAYDKCGDKWKTVDGSGALLSVKKPFALAGGCDGGDSKLYVVGAGLDVAVGTVAGDAVEWAAVRGPPAAATAVASHAVVLHL